MDGFAFYIRYFLIAFFYFVPGNCITVGNCDMDVFFHKGVDTNATNESGEKIVQLLTDVSVGAPLTCISDCCESELCTTVVYSMSRGRGTKNCFMYRCPGHVCPTITNAGTYLYDVKLKIEKTEPPTITSTTTLATTVSKTVETPKTTPRDTTTSSTSTAQQTTSLKTTRTSTKPVETSKTTPRATTTSLASTAKQTTSLKTTRSTIEPVETPKTTPRVTTTTRGSTTQRATSLKTTTRQSTKPIESPESTTPTSTTQRMTTSLQPPHSSTKPRESTAPAKTIKTTTHRISTTSLASTSQRMTILNPTTSTEPRKTTTLRVASSSLTRSTTPKMQTPTSTYVKPITVPPAQAATKVFEQSSSSLAKNDTLTDTPRRFQDSYGVLITFVVFGFMIMLTTIYVVSSRVRESLKNYRYRHYRKVEYLINDQGRWHA